MNSNVLVLASAARTATTTSDAQFNPQARGAILLIDVTAVSGTPNISAITIQVWAGGSWMDWSAQTAITILSAVGTYTAMFYPTPTTGAGVMANTVAFKNAILPKNWRVKFTHDNADSITYEVRAAYVA